MEGTGFSFIIDKKDFARGDIFHCYVVDWAVDLCIWILQWLFLGWKGSSVYNPDEQTQFIYAGNK